MTKAMVAINHATSGGVYYSNDVNFATPNNPTWTRYSTTGLANLLIKCMQNYPADPYNEVYVQLDNFTIYKWNGSSWDELLTETDAETLLGGANWGMGIFTIDLLTSGTLYMAANKAPGGLKMLKSVDYGANWTVSTIDSYNFQSGETSFSAYGQYLFAGSGSLYPSIYLSTNGGSTWTQLNAWPNSSGGPSVKQDPHYPKEGYYQTSATDFDLSRWDGSTNTELWDGYALGPFAIARKADEMWINPLTADHHRIIKTNSTSDRRIYVTTDKWATINSPSNISTVTTASTNWHALHAALENNAYIMFGRGSGTAVTTTPVWALNGETSTSAFNPCGVNTTTPPYTNAIPTVQEGYVAEDGIFVGEAPAASGVNVYSVEHNAFDVDHIPLKGDRASWRDMDADTDDAAVPLADYHAEDIYEDTPQRHNPWPASIGYAPVSDGNKYVATDITTQAELTAHTGTPAAHHDPVTLAADADVLLGLSTQQITLDSQNANTFLGGPTSGAAADPTFRAITLANGDIGDVDITGAGTGDIIYKPAVGDWVDYPLGVGTNITHESGEIRIGDVANGDYVGISDDNGETRLHGNARQWDDIQVTVVLRNTGATTRDPTFTKWFDDSGNTSRGVYIYGFGDEAVNEKELFFTLQMAHRQDIAADVHFHVHWVGDTTADPAVVKWGLEYCWKSPLEVFADTLLVYATTLENDTATGITAYKHNITEFTALTPDATQNGLSSILIGRIFRNSSDAGDTYTGGVAGLLAIDAHILVDSFGSVDEYDKYESDFVLLESGDRLLLESGDKVLLE